MHGASFVATFVAQQSRTKKLHRVCWPLGGYIAIYHISGNIGDESTLYTQSQTVTTCKHGSYNESLATET